MSLSTLWQDCLSQLQDQVSPMDLSTWLRPPTSGCNLARSSGCYMRPYVCEKLGGNHYLAQIHQICQALAKNPNLQIIVKEGVKPAPKAVEPSSTQTANYQRKCGEFSARI